MERRASRPPRRGVGSALIVDAGVRCGQRRRQRLLATAACVAASFVLTVWAMCNGYERGHYADSLIPTLVSLQAWTPFYWEQDRYGMLVPLLLWPIKNPIANLMATTWCNLASGVAATFVLTRFIFGPRSPWPQMATASLALIFWLGAPRYIFDTFGPQQFFQLPLALSVVGLELLAPGGRRRAACGLLSLALAAWVNPVAPAWIAVLVVGEAWAAGRRGLRPRLARQAAGILLAWGVGRACVARFATVRDITLTDLVSWANMRLAAVRLMGNCIRTSREFWWGGVRPGGWPQAAGLVFGQYGERGLPAGRDWPLLPGAWVALAVATLGFSLLSRRYRRGARALAPHAAAAAAVAVVWMALACAQNWVARSFWHERFWLPSFLLWSIVTCGWAVGPALRVAARGRGLLGASVALAVALVASMPVRFGWPSAPGVRAHFERSAGPVLADIEALGCTHVAGDYWWTWPTVFAANIGRYATGGRTPLLGLTHRALATQHLWPGPDDWRICLRPNDASAVNFVRGISRAHDARGVPFMQVAATPRLRVLRVAPASAAP